MGTSGEESEFLSALPPPPNSHVILSNLHPVFNYEGAFLDIAFITRYHMGAYLCIASNGVPPSKSKRIIIIVNCESPQRIVMCVGNKSTFQF